MHRRKRKAIIEFPKEFLELCEYDMIEPEAVLRGFIGDLCALTSWRADGYNSNGADGRRYAKAYYEQVGYSSWAKWQRANEGQERGKASRA